MTDADTPPNKLVEVAGLATALADRILEQHVADTSILPSQFHMLVRATQMLQDNDVPWPPSVEIVFMEIAQRVEQAELHPESTGVTPHGDDVVVDMSQFVSDGKRT